MDSSSCECPDRKCTEEFNSPEQLDIHLNVFRHRRSTEPAKVGLYEKSRIDWVQHFQTISSSDTRENWQQVRATCLQWDGHLESHDPLKGGFLRKSVTIRRKSLKLDSKLGEKRILLKWQMTCGELETQTEKERSPELSGLPSFKFRVSPQDFLPGKG